MRENYTLTRIYIESRLSGAQTVELTKEQAHYLGTVLRRKTGDELRVFNGENGEWRAKINKVNRKGGEIRLLEQLRPAKPMPDIWVCFAPVRKHRTAFIIEKGTELGVSEFHPIQTQRTQFPKLNIEKARVQAIEAAEQTERLTIPIIKPLQNRGITEMLKGWDVGRSLFFADEAGEAKPALDVLLEAPSGPAAILIGPEGGFTPIEREELRRQPYVNPISLGPRILRADTAALSLLTLWQAVKGDWR